MIGLMNRRAELLAPGRVPDEAGGAVLGFTHKEYAWAQIERLASTQDLSGDRGKRLRRIAATLRYRPDVRLGERLRLDGVDYEIVSIESADGRDKRLVLVCEEVAA